MARKKLITQRLSPNDIKLTCQIIKEMAINIRPTWEKVMLIVEEVTLKKFTRQTLSANHAINEQYQERVDAYRKLRVGGKPPKEQIDDPIAEEIKTLNNEVAELKETIAVYDELLMRIIANAIKHGISQEQLETPLEPIEQGRTDLDELAGKTRAARVAARRRAGTRSKTT